MYSTRITLALGQAVNTRRVNLAMRIDAPSFSTLGCPRKITDMGPGLSRKFTESAKLLTSAIGPQTREPHVYGSIGLEKVIYFLE